jgi:multidrug resistance efflux pump
MDPLPPIPIPLALRWREFRVRALPILIFLVAIGGVCFVWRHNLAAPTLVGAVETRDAEIISPSEGKITQLNFNRFQNVLKGMPVAVLVPTDPRTALAVIQSDLDILNTRLEPQLTEQRNKTAYQQLRLNWMVQKVDLATTRVNLELARDELQRDEALFKQKIVSGAVYDSALKAEQALAAEVMERSNLVVVAESSIKKLQDDGVAQAPSASVDFLMNALQVEEQKLKEASTGTEPITLTATMDGMVSMVYRQVGEYVSEGNPILTITEVEPEHIISYLRQPIPFEPKAGMEMEVRTRTMQIQSGMARIQSVGSQFETVTNSLAIIRPGKPVDLGLPIEISLPPGFKLRPGEIVDLTLHPVD